jgi:hypothetical protein
MDAESSGEPKGIEQQRCCIQRANVLPSSLCTNTLLFGEGFVNGIKDADAVLTAHA